MNQRNSFLANMPPAVKALLIINVAVMLLDFIIASIFHIEISEVGGLRYFKSDFFKPFQIITHMFMHGGLMHLLFNMYALWMFGQILEQVWGPKRFVIYYMATGLGAAALHMIVSHLEIQSMMNAMDPAEVKTVLSDGADALRQNKNFVNSAMATLNANYNGITVGASGAVFGLLLAFGMLFPNQELMLMFIPVPIKAKWFVIGYGAIELFSGIANRPGDNVAHFAHLGGMIFGFILIKIWQKDRDTFY